MSDMAYHMGVFMGDGFVERYKPGSSVVYIGLKAVDKDFVEHYQQVLYRLTGKLYKIHVEDDGNPKHNVRYRCRVGDRALVEKTRGDTELKKVIPNWIINGSNEDKKAFIQGVMDSEAWVNCSLHPIGPSAIQLSVGVTSSWVKDFHRLFADLGITTTKIGTRKFDNQPEFLTPRKDFHSFSIHLLEYVDAGLGFNIKRKQDRLNYCSRILRDYTREYPRYSSYLGRRYSPALSES